MTLHTNNEYNEEAEIERIVEHTLSIIDVRLLRLQLELEQLADCFDGADCDEEIPLSASDDVLPIFSGVHKRMEGFQADIDTLEYLRELTNESNGLLVLHLLSNNRFRQMERSKINQFLTLKPRGRSSTINARFTLPNDDELLLFT